MTQEEQKLSNPPAYPTQRESGSGYIYVEEGMVLRDNAALKFANGYISGSLDVIGHGMNFDMKNIVKLSFEFADEFLKQREL